MCEPIAEKDIHKVDGSLLLSGSFGVVKPGEVVGHDLLVSRLIFNLIPSNGMFEVISGDIDTLAGSVAWLPIVLEDQEIGFLSGEDLISAFYLFFLPRT